MILVISSKQKLLKKDVLKHTNNVLKLDANF